MWIDKDIKLGDRTGIAWHANRSTHDYEAAKLLHERRSQLNGTRNIRERSQGNHGQVATIALHHLQQMLHRLPMHCRLLQDRITWAAVRMAQVRHPAQTVLLMKGSGGVQGTAQWAAQTLGHCRPHGWRQQGQYATGISCRHGYRNIASDGGNQLDTQFRRAQSEHQRQRIIDAWVSINRYWARSCGCRHASYSPVPLLGLSARCRLIGGSEQLDGMHYWDI